MAKGHVELTVGVVADHARVGGLIDEEVEQSVGVMGVTDSIVHVADAVIKALVGIVDAHVGRLFLTSYICSSVSRVRAFDLIEFAAKRWKVGPYALVESHELGIDIIYNS